MQDAGAALGLQHTCVAQPPSHPEHPAATSTMRLKLAPTGRALEHDRMIRASLERRHHLQCNDLSLSKCATMVVEYDGEKWGSETGEGASTQNWSDSTCPEEKNQDAGSAGLCPGPAAWLRSNCLERHKRLKGSHVPTPPESYKQQENTQIKGKKSLLHVFNSMCCECE